MPTYQYACTACDERLEVVQKFSDAPLTECPACGDRLRKVFSAVGVVFKGSGFYRTDSRSSSNGAPKKEPAKKDSSADAGAGSTGGDSSSSSGSDSSSSSSSSSGSSSSTSSGAATSRSSEKVA